MGRASDGDAATAERGATQELRRALERGEALTRVQACERYGITGATFRWTIKSMRDAGAVLEFELVAGGRGNSAKRWKMVSENSRTKGR